MNKRGLNLINRFIISKVSVWPKELESESKVILSKDEGLIVTTPLSLKKKYAIVTIKLALKDYIYSNYNKYLVIIHYDNSTLSRKLEYTIKFFRGKTLLASVNLHERMRYSIIILNEVPDKINILIKAKNEVLSLNRIYTLKIKFILMLF